jgi:hypothetical protein
MQFYLLRPNVKMGVKIDDANIRLYLPVPIVEIMSFVMSQCHLTAASDDDRETAIRKYFVYRLSQGCRIIHAHGIFIPSKYIKQTSSRPIG